MSINERYKLAVEKMDKFLAQDRSYIEIPVYFKKLADIQIELMEIHTEAIGELLGEPEVRP